MTYLQNKYGSISALNAAWGSNYTAFGDAGGYGVGTGVLDEDGRHSWMGHDWNNLSDEPVPLQNDMNGFLYQYVYQGWNIAVSTIRSYDRNHLIIGPSAIGGIGNCGVRRSRTAGAERRRRPSVANELRSAQSLDHRH